MLFVLTNFHSKFRPNRCVLSNENSMKIQEGKRKFDITIFRRKEISIEICYNETKYRRHFQRGESLIMLISLRMSEVVVNVHNTDYGSIIYTWHPFQKSTQNSGSFEFIFYGFILFSSDEWGFFKWFVMFLLISDVMSCCSVTTMFTQSRL